MISVKLSWDGCQYSLVNIGSGNGLLPSGNKPVAIWQQAITCANVDIDLSRHKASTGHNEFIMAGVDKESPQMY